jgi:type III pantothenate kinase
MAATTFLLVDVGNTRVKWATARPRGPLRAASEVATREATPAWIKDLARKFPNHPVVLASVVPRLIPVFRRIFATRLAAVANDFPRRGLAFDYPRPRELGADRLAAAAAVHAAGLYPAIIIACGTATAFTVLDAKGRLCGGAIAPGLQAQLDALVGATAQLPATALRMPRSARAKSTREAIRAGVMLNFRGGVKEIVRELSKTLPARPRPHLVLTGGNAHLLVKELGAGVKLRPLLVLEGLRIIGAQLFATGHAPDHRKSHRS